MIEEGGDEGSAGVGRQATCGFGDVPVVAQRVGAQVPENSCLVAGAQQLDNRQAHAVRRRTFFGPQHHPRIGHDGRREPPPRRRDGPGARHLEVGVQREVTGEPGEQVLAVRDMAQHRQPGQVRRRVRGYPQLAVGQHAVAKRTVEAAGQRVYGVTLGHVSIVPSS